MVKRLLSLLLTASMLCGIPVAFAEDEEITVESNGVVSTENFTEDNVIYKAMQNNKRGTSPRRVKSSKAAALSDNEETVTADFDVVLGFDMSADMYDFDYNGEMSWLENFEALSEQVPDGTRFSVVTDEAGEFVTDLNTEIEGNKNLTYSGESDIITLLDNCADTFDDASEDRNKVVIAATANVEDEAELADKIEELQDDGVIPFVFVLNSNIEDNEYDSANMYICESELDLRISLSDLYISYIEFRDRALNEKNSFEIENYNENEFVTTSPEATTEPQRVICMSDLRERHIYNGAKNKGAALISILNMYSCLPLNASSEDSSYDITALPFEDIYDLLKGNSNKLNGLDIGEIESFYKNIYEKLSNKNNIVEIIQKNLERRFPVIVEYENKDNTSNVGIVSKIDGDTLFFDFQNETDGGIDINEVISVFDTYNYLNSIAVSSKKVITSLTQTGTELKLTKVYGVNYDASKVKVLWKKAAVSEDNKRTSNKNIYEIAVDLINNDGNKVIVSAPVEFENNLPKMYDNSVFYTLLYYKDVLSENLWYYNYIMDATKLNIVGGYDDKTFRPEPLFNDSEKTNMSEAEKRYGYVTRAEFIKMILIAAGICDENGSYIVKENDTEVINLNHWAKAFISKAINMGILLGIDKDSDVSIYDELIPRYEVAYAIKKLFIDNADQVTVPTLLYEYDGSNKNEIKESSWKIIENSILLPENFESNKADIVEAMRQLYMNDVFVGDENGLRPMDYIKRGEFCKIVTKPLYKIDENTPQILVNMTGGNENNIVNLNLDSSGVEIQDIVFDGQNKRQYSLTINEGDDNKYYIGTYGGLKEGQQIELTIETEANNDKQQYGQYSNIDGHPARWIQGEGKYILTIERKSSNKSYDIFNVGLKIKGVNVPQIIKFDKVYEEDDMPVYYIYCNNHEAIRRENIVNRNTLRKMNNQSFGDDKLSWLMSLEHLTPGKYVIFVSHNNETAYNFYDEANYYYNNAEDYDPRFNEAFNIYLDARIKKQGNITANVKRIGYWSCNSQDSNYDKRDGVVTSWSALQAWSNYLGENIKEQDQESFKFYVEEKNDENDETKGTSTNEYTANKWIGKEYKVADTNISNQELKFNNNIAWLSSVFTSNSMYMPCEPSTPVFMIAEIVVQGDYNAYIDVDIGAFDDKVSRNISNAVKKGEFVPQPQIKGIANCSPQLTTEMSFTIDDETSFLPFITKNAMIENEYEIGDDWFRTFGTPQSDTCGQTAKYVENDILDFDYNGFNYNMYDGWESKGDEVGIDGKCHQLANFGVETKYVFYIENISSKNKELVYNMLTATNYLAQMSSEVLSGKNNEEFYYLTGSMPETEDIKYTLIGRGECNYVNKYNEADQYTSEKNMAKVSIPAHSRVKIILRVISPTNVRGSLGNKLIVTNVE